MKVHRRLLIFRTVLALAVALAAAGPATAAAPRPATAETTATADALAYAQTYGVGPAEASKRLSLQLVAGVFQEVLSTAEAATLAGVWIEHTPEFRVVVAVTDPLAASRVRALAPGELSGVLDVRTATYPLSVLDAAADAGRRVVAKLGFDAASATDVRGNRATVTVTDRTAVEAALRRAGRRLPNTVELREQAWLAKPAADIHGGLVINGCTSGFSVQNAAGTKGIALAGHCPDDQSYSGVNLPFQSQVYTGDADSQWNSATSFDVRPYIYDSIQDATAGYRLIRGSVARANQVVGSTVCKYGRTTGYGCGTIEVTNGNPGNGCVPNATNSFVHVLPVPGQDLAEGGDSGGPWFADANAYGTMSCQSPNAGGWYTPIDTTLSRLGVQLLTGIGPGERLTTGQLLRSPNGSHRAIMQADGNFVVYNSANAALWASNTAGNPAAYFSVGYDGNFVVNRADGLVLWGANTMGGQDMAYLSLQNDGNLVLVPASDSPWIRWGTRSSLVECRRLFSGQSLRSPNGRYRATMQADGNLVVYNQSNVAIWDTGTTGNTNAWLDLQCDGNLVIYRPGPVPVWESGTAGRTTSRMTLLDDGTLKLYTRTNLNIWGSDRDMLYPTKELQNDRTIVSRNGQYHARMQADGNFVLYTAAGSALWATNTAGNPNAKVVMQGDGNLVVYTTSGVPIWSSGTPGWPDTLLLVTDFGKLQLVAANGSVIRQYP